MCSTWTSMMKMTMILNCIWLSRLLVEQPLQCPCWTLLWAPWVVILMALQPVLLLPSPKESIWESVCILSLHNPSQSDFITPFRWHRYKLTLLLFSDPFLKSLDLVSKLYSAPVRRNSMLVSLFTLVLLQPRRSHSCTESCNRRSEPNLGGTYRWRGRTPRRTGRLTDSRH